MVLWGSIMFCITIFVTRLKQTLSGIKTCQLKLVALQKSALLRYSSAFDISNFVYTGIHFNRPDIFRSAILAEMAFETINLLFAFNERIYDRKR